MKQIKIATNVEVYAYEELDAEHRQLVEAAQEAAHNAYAPYSQFHVGAALLLDDEQLQRLADGRGGLHHFLRIEPLAAQTDHDHAAHVGMAGHGGQGACGQLQVHAHLGAAHRMGHGDGAGDLLGDPLNSRIGAKNRRNDSQIVPNTYRAVRPAITHKSLIHYFFPRKQPIL